MTTTMTTINATYHAAFNLLPLPVQYIGKGDELYSGIHSPAITINAWSLFDKAWIATMGYSTQDFKFVPGQTPLSTLKETATAISLYYIIIFGGREIMRNFPAFQLNKLFIIHNFYLTAISGALLLLFAQELVPGLWKNGLFDGICGSTGWSQNLLVLYYLNYLTKYLELLDTVFLVLKKKPLTFLHTYHHGATALLCYTQLRGHTSVSWVPITLNLAVHVVMYWYYFQSARGVRIWWKKYITAFQITQFILDLGFIYFACWNFYASVYNPSLPHVGNCGHPAQIPAASTGCAIITSYLFLFIGFYISTYKKPSIKKAARRASKCEVPNVQGTAAAATEVIEAASNAVRDTLADNKIGVVVKI